MTVLRSLLTTVLAISVSSTALATPIAYGDGMVDGVLRSYRLVTDATGTKLDVVLLHDYELGTDFYPTIPRSFVDNALPYSRCLQAALNRSVLNSPPECLSFFFQVTTEIFGQGDLRDGCTFIANATERPPGRPVMVARGGCTFSEKWAFAQSQGWGGIMVVNDAPGPVGVAGLIPLPVEPTIAFMSSTTARRCTSTCTASSCHPTSTRRSRTASTSISPALRGWPATAASSAAPTAEIISNQAPGSTRSRS